MICDAQQLGRWRTGGMTPYPCSGKKAHGHTEPRCLCSATNETSHPCFRNKSLTRNPQRQNPDSILYWSLTPGLSLFEESSMSATCTSRRIMHSLTGRRNSRASQRNCSSQVCDIESDTPGDSSSLEVMRIHNSTMTPALRRSTY